MEETKKITDPQLDNFILSLQKNINLTQSLIAQAQQNLDVISELAKQIILKNESIKANYESIIAEFKKVEK